MRRLAVTLQHAAHMLHVHPDTVRRAIRRGFLTAYKLGPERGAHVRVLPPDLRA
jgi:excisionase family DNA binding protein